MTPKKDNSEKLKHLNNIFISLLKLKTKEFESCFTYYELKLISNCVAKFKYTSSNLSSKQNKLIKNINYKINLLFESRAKGGL